MNSLIINTDRLVMRPFKNQDAVHMFHLNSDPRVLKYTGDIPFKTISEAEDFLDSYDQWTQYQMGRFSVFHKANGRYLGWSGLRFDSENNMVDLGFRFAYMYWGTGYATESGKAFLEYGFNSLKLTSIIARAHKANAASIRVMQKLGMQFVKEIKMDGQDGVLYAIEK